MRFFCLFALLLSVSCVTADEIAAASGTIAPDYEPESARQPQTAHGVTIQFNTKLVQAAELRISPRRLLAGRRSRQALEFCQGSISYEVIGNREYPKSPATLRVGAREVPFMLFRKEFLRDYGAPLEIWRFSAHWQGIPATTLEIRFSPAWEYVVDAGRQRLGGGRVPEVLKDPIEALADGAPYWFSYRWRLPPIAGEFKWPALVQESRQLRGHKWIVFDTWGDATELEPGEEELHPPYLEVVLGECVL